MNYYEEFGIDRNATATEIREAYKLAARLLHPDNQREPRLKDMAECQMKRLSDVVAVLLNPRQRTRYDEKLDNESRLGQLIPLAPPGGPQFLQTLLRHWFWVLLGSMTMLTIGMGAWYGLARNTDAPPLSAAAENATVPTAKGAAQSEREPVTNLRVKPAEIPPKTTAEAETPAGTKTTRGEYPPIGHRAGAARLPMVSATATAPIPAQAPTAPPKDEQRSVPPTQESEHAQVAWGPGEPRFTGQWLYAADGIERDSAGTYPATYVEFQLREESGILVGDYRSRHRIADKAISPEVAFRVRGAPSTGTSGKLSWSSSGGAKGEVELTLRSPNQLQLRWWTTQFGRQEALTSGMAVLTRLKMP